jgi:hypothetical protein
MNSRDAAGSISRLALEGDIDSANDLLRQAVDAAGSGKFELGYSLGARFLKQLHLRKRERDCRLNHGNSCSGRVSAVDLELASYRLIEETEQ